MRVVRIKMRKNMENNNKDINNSITEGEMATKKKKRIYNPVTGKYYEVRQKSTKKGQKGQIKGLWKKKKKK
jgi:hypothetical protein